MTDSHPVQTARATGPLAFLAMGLLVLAVAGVTTMLCWTPAHAIHDEILGQDWTVVPARITEARVEFRHTPRMGKRSAWDGWCASWKYAYEWHGANHWAIVGDSTPSTLAPGCFAFQAGAQQALARHPLDTTLQVRVDPASPWHSSTQPAGVRGGDIVALLFGLTPALIFVGGCVAGLRARGRPSPRVGHR